LLRRCDGTVLDRGLVLTFPAPASATGEDVSELHLHGGPAVIAAVLDALTALPDVRLADAGEFTRRAFDNGRLDLTQVEGLADLLSATTEAQRAQATAQMEGALAKHGAEWRERLLNVLALIEATIDFADESDVDAEIDAVDVETKDVREEIQSTLSQAAHGERVRDGLVIVLAGAPNVGKSSLLNALTRREAAIVSPYAGTTRDMIDVQLDLNGVPVTLVDTAGLRHSFDPIEAAGVARARARADTADLVLLLSDRQEWSGPGQRVRTKIDLSPDRGDIPDVLAISARTGEGIGALVAWLKAWAGSQLGRGETALVTQARQREALEQAAERLVDAVVQKNAVLKAEAIRLALRALGRLAGVVDVEDVLATIFGRFCIGK